jgi:hypothetical protein
LLLAVLGFTPAAQLAAAQLPAAQLAAAQLTVAQLSLIANRKPFSLYSFALDAI